MTLVNRKSQDEFLESHGTNGVYIKAVIIKDYAEVSGVHAKKTQASFLAMGEGEAYENGPAIGNGSSFSGIYIWFSRTLAAVEAMADSMLPEGVDPEEFKNNLFVYLVFALYIGMSDNVFDRILAPGKGKPDGHGVGKFMYGNDLTKSDLTVAVMTVADAKTHKLLTGAKLKEFESALHLWNEENSPQEVRHLLHNYSGAKGQLGSEMATVQSVIAKANEAKVETIMLKLIRRSVELQYGALLDKVEDAVHDFDLDEGVE